MKRAVIPLVFIVFLSLAFAQVATEQQATSALEDSLAILAEMKAADFGVVHITDIFILLNYSYINKNYANVLARASEISDIRDWAFQINDSFKIFEDKMLKYSATGLNVSAAGFIYAMAKDSFQKEMYDTSEEQLANAYKKLEEIKTENVMSQTILEAGKRNLAYFIKENIVYILVGAVAVFVAAILIYSRFEIIMARKKLADLELERGVIFELMKKAQTECYQNRVLSYDEYKAKMARFKERLMHINEELPALKLKAVQELPSLDLRNILDAIPLFKKKR